MARYSDTNSAVGTLTLEGQLPKVTDEVFGANAFTMRLMARPKRWAGRTLDKAIKYQLSNSISSFSGLDGITPSLLNTKVRMSFDLRGLHTDVTIDGISYALNNSSGKAKIVDLVNEAVEEKKAEMADYLGTQAYGTGLGNSSKDIVGLGALIDDATDVTTYGNLSRSTYTVLNATRTAVTGGVFTLSDFSTLYNAISNGTTNSTPTVALCGNTVFGVIEATLTPQMRATYEQIGYYTYTKNDMLPAGSGSNKGLIGNGGFVAMNIKGVPVVKDTKTTSGNLTLVNDSAVDWYGASMDKFGDTWEEVKMSMNTIDTSVYNDSGATYFGMNWSGFKTNGQASYVTSELSILGNIVSFRPNYFGRLTGITTS